MKKSILCVALMGVLSNFAVANTEPAELFERDYLEVQKRLLDPYDTKMAPFIAEMSAFEANKNDVNYELLIRNSEYIDVNSVVILLWPIKGEAKLSSYKEKRGKAKIKAEVSPTFDLMGAKIFTGFTVVKAGKLEGTLNNSDKTYEDKIVFEKQVIPLRFDTEVSEQSQLAFDEIKFFNKFKFTKDYSAVEHFEKSTSVKQFVLHILDNQDDVTVSFEHAVIDSNSNIEKIDIKNEVTIKEFEIDVKDKLNIKLPLISSNAKIQKSEKTTASLDYEVEVAVDQITIENNLTKGGKSQFGSHKSLIGLKEIDFEKGKLLISQLANLQEMAKSGSKFDQEQEGLKILKLVSEAISDKTTFSLDIKSEAENKKTLNFKFSIKPTSELLLAMTKPEEEAIQVSDKKPADLIERYLNELTIHLEVEDEYIIKQYTNGLIVENAGTDVKEAEKKAQQNIQMIQMGAAMFTAEGLTLIKRNETNSLIDISYKNSQWDINGKKFTTKELMDLINNLPFHGF